MQASSTVFSVPFHTSCLLLCLSEDTFKYSSKSVDSVSNFLVNKLPPFVQSWISPMSCGSMRDSYHVSLCSSVHGNVLLNMFVDLALHLKIQFALLGTELSVGWDLDDWMATCDKACLVKMVKFDTSVISLILFRAHPISRVSAERDVWSCWTHEWRTKGNLMSSMKLINFECSAWPEGEFFQHYHYSTL